MASEIAIEWELTKTFIEFFHWFSVELYLWEKGVAIEGYIPLFGEEIIKSIS